MAGETFVDTSGFYAMLVRGDDRHEAAAEHLHQARERRGGFITTEHVLDETGTLLKARGLAHRIDPFFDSVMDSTACRVEWTDAPRFSRCVTFFRKHADQDWSFTDCLSFLVMRELGLREALTKDAHFEHAGFTALLG